MNVLLGQGPAGFILENHDVTRSVFDNRRIDYNKALIVEQPRGSKSMKVFCGGDVDPMVASIVATPVGGGKTSGDCRRPEQEVLSFPCIIEELRHPNV